MRAPRRTAHGPRSKSRHSGLTIQLALILLVVLAAGVVAGFGTWAAYTDTTVSPSSNFAAGSVDIDDNDGGTALLSIANGTPGSSDSGCIRVSYAGSLPANVRLYGSTSGTGLDQHLDVVVTRGTIPAGAFHSCTGFTADALNYIGAGPGVIYSGTLQGFPDNFAAGLVDPPGVPELWTSGETHAYRLTVTVQSNSAAQGRNAAQTFTWEARNT
jgi:predicted ribosomally synthesized peptide with SipW-like signal peptide